MARKVLEIDEELEEVVLFDVSGRLHPHDVEHDVP